MCGELEEVLEAEEPVMGPERVVPLESPPSFPTTVSIHKEGLEVTGEAGAVTEEELLGACVGHVRQGHLRNQEEAWLCCCSNVQDGTQVYRDRLPRELVSGEWCVYPLQLRS